MSRLLLALVCCGGLAAQAWSTRPCSTNSSLQPSYGGAVWPLTYLSNMPSGSAGRLAVGDAMLSWNSIVGAVDNLSAPTGGYGFCTKPDNAGVSVIGWDDGTCHSWATSEVGVTVVWTQSCAIVKESVYFNSSFPFSSVELESTALHELGHYQNFAHDWYELSIMGYSATSFTFLTAADHRFLRGVWPSGRTALPDLYLNRIVASSPIVPDAQSMEQSAPPTCSGSCSDVQTGDSISVRLSYGNAGSTAVPGTFQIQMKLGTHVIGAWSQSNYPAHAQDTYWFTATVPPGVPPGTYALTVEIDPAGTVTQANGPTSGEVVSFPGFVVRPPLGWTCNALRYNALDGCDCECGIADPDCTATSVVARGCGDANTCTDDRCDAAGHCVYPNNVASCEDGLFCTTSDRCASGTCAPGTARDCSAQSNACNLGVCNETQRACLRSPRNEGGACDDGLFCTVGDTCAAGTCGGGSARDCSALDSVCAQGRCDESVDRCVAAPINTGQTCDDGLRCTTGDSCRSGSCSGTPVNCASLNTPCTRGECDPATGACVAVPLLDGTACSGGAYCTVGQTCTAGVCGGGQARSCAALDSSCAQGVCDEAADACRASPRNEGGACSDGRFCTQNDTCRAGTCTGNARDCSAQTSTCTVGICDEVGQRCAAAPANEGVACDDGEYCSTDDSCYQGQCLGYERDCSQLTNRCAVGACDEGRKACVSQPRNEGLLCDDGELCTLDDFCEAGACRPGSRRDCSGLTSSCAVGQCDPSNGTCVRAALPDGSACNDQSSCTTSDSCRQGVCSGTALDCSRLTDSCHVGRCDEGTGQCQAFGKVGPCDAPPSGCGCDSARAPALLLVALALATTRRRRRYC